MHPPPSRAGVVTVAYAILAAGTLALSTWQAHLSRQSAAARWSVAIIVVVTFGVALVLGRGRQSYSTRRWAARNVLFVRTWRIQSPPVVISALVWTALIVAVVVWDLVSFVFQSHALPTLSYFIGHVTRYPLGRGLLFAAWLGIGTYLACARRTERPQ